MARNYLHDVTPDPDDSDEALSPRARPRSIRDFRPSAERQRLQTPSRTLENRAEYREENPQHRTSRWGMWVAAMIAVIVLGGAGALVLFPSTTVTVTPRSHVMPFDASNPLTAYPANGAAPGAISYTVTTQVFEDSAVVTANGTEKAEEKATGNITIYNDYSDKPVRLIKNTRLQTPDGLIFRIPASVDVPGKSGSAPGSITVTVFADETGPKYNIPPTDKFTVPGLKSTPDMYAKVYGKSTAAFTGGFSGTRPAVTPSVLDAAKAEIRGRLAEKAQELSKTAPQGTIAFSGLMAVTFEEQPATDESGGSVRIHEKATVTMPVFPADAFASAVAQAVSADAEGQAVSINFSNDIAAKPVGSLSAADIGTQPVVFTLSGRGELVWQVDENALAQALAGREQSAFQTIIKGFPAVEEARARLTPFWKSSFPKNPNDIKINVEKPTDL